MLQGYQGTEGLSIAHLQNISISQKPLQPTWAPVWSQQPQHSLCPRLPGGSLEAPWRPPGGIGLHTRPLSQLLCTPVAVWSSFPSHPHYIQLLTHMFHFAIVLHIIDSIPYPQNSYVKILIPQYFRCICPWI